MKSERRSDEDIARRMEILKQLPEDRDGLLTKISDLDPVVRQLAVMRIGQLEDPTVVLFLLKAFDDENHEVRASAALALDHYEDPQSLPAILHHLANDPSPRVRAMCVHPARTIGGDVAMDNVASALDDPDEHVRYAACWQFAHHNDRRAVGKIHTLLNDPFPMVRSGAATVLIRLGVVDEPVMDVLVSDTSWDVRREVANELIKAGVADQRIVGALKQLMREPEAEEYEERISDYLAYKESDEYKATAIDLDDEELSEEDREMFREWEDSLDKPLAELLDKAISLLKETAT